ncbi:MAG: elongation factor P maturation arginine rhamnosyltransferase EarP [Candidatus Accumulibacter sp.]|nr:elongation factor P maturation arginine rhamnosyltransferase EarP [Accumulibacter sp.]
MNTPSLYWDIFCTVVDNHGDIGVAWRLARQLAREYGFPVRLWADDLSAFQRICPEISPARSVQCVMNVEIRMWDKNSAGTCFPLGAPPANIVIETFGCRAPDSYSRAMASVSPQTIWINLDYLSAEAWVETCHMLPSPHPRLPQAEYFFFPGFTEKTGGLLRERGLEKDARDFLNSPERKAILWKTLGFTVPAQGTQTFFLFAYENTAIPGLLDFLAAGDAPVRCLVPPCESNEKIFRSIALSGKTLSRGRLELCFLTAFVPQTEFDALLLISDFLFIRGEDSFVRSQWAERPFVWNIYPQERRAHFSKLDAFLDLYCENLSHEASKAVRAFHQEWNKGFFSPETCADWMACLPDLRVHAKNWAEHLKKQDDLCRSLVKFCLSKL